MTFDDKNYDFWNLMDEWSLEDRIRVEEVFEHEPFGEMMKAYIVKRGEKNEAKKQDKGGAVKALNSMPRTLRIQLYFLYLTIDLGVPQHVTRGELAKWFNLSTKRISNLTSPKKPPSPKK